MNVLSFTPFSTLRRSLFVLSLLSGTLSYAQDAEKTAVVVHADPRLDVLLKKHHTYMAEPEAPAATDVPSTPKPPVVVYTGPGYRVQIYNGPDRNKALRIKTDFMKRFSGIHSYISYSAPSFRIKVGDFRTHGEAEKLQNELNDKYVPTMVVPDNVTIMSY